MVTGIDIVNIYALLANIIIIFPIIILLLYETSQQDQSISAYTIYFS